MFITKIALLSLLTATVSLFGADSTWSSALLPKEIIILQMVPRWNSDTQEIQEQCRLVCKALKNSIIVRVERLQLCLEVHNPKADSPKLRMAYSVGLMNMLKDNQLTTEKISFSKTNEAGFKLFYKSLSTNTTLTTLNLCQNSIWETEIHHLSDVLKISTAITSLHLSFNKISDEGAFDLSQALERNTSLISLNLKANNISDGGAFYFSQAFKFNTSLTSLNLEANHIKDDQTKQWLLKSAHEKLTIIF